MGAATSQLLQGPGVRWLANAGTAKATAPAGYWIGVQITRVGKSPWFGFTVSRPASEERQRLQAAERQVRPPGGEVWGSWGGAGAHCSPAWRG